MHLNPGDTAWVLAATALVLIMTPGLAFFYGGMVRSKSVLNMIMMSFSALGLVGVLWVLYGYSMAFGNDVGGGLVGNPFQFLGLEGTFGGTYLATAGGPPVDVPLVGTVPATDLPIRMLITSPRIFAEKPAFGSIMSPRPPIGFQKK